MNTLYRSKALSAAYLIDYWRCGMNTLCRSKALSAAYLID